MKGRTALYTLLALVAFAANSVLCRLALAGHAIDPGSFTLIRIAAGTLTLGIVAWLTEHHLPKPDRRAVVSGFWLFLYAIAFAWAYLELGAGTGALILFGAVQLTMIAVGFARGETLSAKQAAGLSLAIVGLVYLVSPKLHAPPTLPALAMALAGAAWGAYSLRARGVARPLPATAANFAAALPLCSLAAFTIGTSDFTAYGVALAVASGAIASGLGYVVWYAALRELAATSAAAVQLAVPVIAALGGVVFLGERITVELLGAGTAILAGIAMVLRYSPRTTPAR